MVQEIKTVPEQFLHQARVGEEHAKVLSTRTTAATHTAALVKQNQPENKEERV